MSHSEKLWKIAQAACCGKTDGFCDMSSQELAPDARFDPGNVSEKKVAPTYDAKTTQNARTFTYTRRLRSQQINSYRTNSLLPGTWR